MQTLAEILKAKTKKIEETKTPKAPHAEPISYPFPLPSDIHHVLAFLYLINNPDHHQDYISILDFLGIPYTPWIIKSASEQPLEVLALLVVRYYTLKYPINASLELSAHVLRGVGRILNDKQQALLITEIERKLKNAARGSQ